MSKLSGKIIRKVGDKNMACLVLRFARSTYNNMAVAKVIYFKYTENEGKDLELSENGVRDDKFCYPYNEFLTEYEYIENADQIKTFKDAHWQKTLWILG